MGTGSELGTWNELGTKNELESAEVCEEYTATREEGVKHKIAHETDSGELVMNVEERPWFFDETEVKENNRHKVEPVQNWRETRRVIFSSLLAALMVGGVFIVGFFVFLLFVTNIWF